jgi:pimeloyl-ACP methyl ester carboxylesterase
MQVEGTLLVLPGWGGSQETWSVFRKYYSEVGKIVIIDLPCFGVEPCPSTPWGVEEYVQFVTGKILTEHGKIHLLGHSFGGQVATMLVARHPDMIETLTLVGAAVIRSRIPMKRVIYGTIAKVGKILLAVPLLSRFAPFAKKILYKLADSPDYPETSGIQRAIHRKVIRQDLSHLLPSIAVPTLVLWGEDDKYTPVSDGKRVAKLIKQSTFITFKNGTHGLHHGGTLQPMISTITNFIQKHTTR